MAWWELERRLSSSQGIDHLMSSTLKSEVDKWQDLLHRLFDVTLFLGERGLAFQGDSSKIGDPHNGNFLSLLELLANYDSTMRHHLDKVKESQDRQERLQVHYLSWFSQNEFIQLLGDEVLQCIIHEIRASKYFSFMVDGTPDVSHQDQNTFITRHLLQLPDLTFEPVDRFLFYKANNDKSGEENAKLIMSTFNDAGIDLE